MPGPLQSRAFVSLSTPITDACPGRGSLPTPPLLWTGRTDQSLLKSLGNWKTVLSFVTTAQTPQTGTAGLVSLLSGTAAGTLPKLAHPPPKDCRKECRSQVAAPGQPSGQLALKVPCLWKCHDPSSGPRALCAVLAADLIALDSGLPPGASEPAAQPRARGRTDGSGKQLPPGVCLIPNPVLLLGETPATPFGGVAGRRASSMQPFMHWDTLRTP